MNITQTIKNIKCNQRSPKISLIVKNENNKIKIQTFAVQQGNLLEKNSIEETFITDAEKNIITLDFNENKYKEKIEKELQKTYSFLDNASDEDLLKESQKLMNLDFIKLFICSGLNVPLVKELQFFFYKKFVIINSTFEDGTDQAIILVNILFNKDDKTELEFVQKEVESFIYTEEEAKESEAWKDISDFYDFIQKSQKFDFFPYDAWYDNSSEEIIKQIGRNINEM